MLPSYLSENHLLSLIRLAKEEDLGLRGDHSSKATLGATDQAKAEIIAKQNGVVAGLGLLPYLQEVYGAQLKTTLHKEDGEVVNKGELIAELSSSAHSLLAIERPLLNFLQRLSGIASLTAEMAALLAESPTKLLDTRKTTPGYRGLEKWAVSLGGGTNHRIGLYDRIMLKENHIAGAGGLDKALAKTRDYLGTIEQQLMVEVEIENLDQLRKLLQHDGVDIVLLDNMSTEDLKTAVRLVAGRMKTEASGNMNAARLKELAPIGLDYISMGALTHSAKALDISLYLR